MTPSSARMHPDVPDTTSSPGQMKTRHLLRHIQRALARVIGELTSSGTGYTGPEQTNEKRISGSGNRSCLGCRRTYQPFMQGRRPADDQQHRRAERRECAPRPGRGPITMREQTHRVTWFHPCRFRALRDHFGGARGLRAEEPILSFLLSSPNLGPLTYPAFYGIWQAFGDYAGHGACTRRLLHRCHAAGGLLSATFPPAIRRMLAEVPAPCAHDQKIVSRQRGSRGAGLAAPESRPGPRGPCRIRCRCPRRGCRPGWPPGPRR